MIWIILLIVIGIVLFSFFSSLNKDKRDLKNIALPDKFRIIVQLINDEAFNSLGEITVISEREFHLYKIGENQIIQFYYSTGNLTIIWKYKYFQKEVIHEKQYNDVRNLSVFEQQKIAEEIINEMDTIVMTHKKNVYSVFQITVNENPQNLEENNTKTFEKKVSVDEVSDKLNLIINEFVGINDSNHFDIIKVNKVETVLYELDSNEIFVFKINKKSLTMSWIYQVSHNQETNECEIDDFWTFNIEEIRNTIKCFLSDNDKIKIQNNVISKDIQPKNIIILYLNKKAEQAFNNSENETCINYCSEVLKIDNNNEFAYRIRGHAYNMQLKYAEAIDDFSELIKIDPLNADAYSARGFTYLRLIESRPNMDNRELSMKCSEDMKKGYEIKKSKR